MTNQRSLFSPSPAAETEATLHDADVATLAQIVEKYDKQYFVDGRSDISDALYDRVKNRLRELSPNHPLLDRIEPVSADNKVEHKVPMRSLDKVYAFDDLLEWYDKFEGSVIGSHKIDGLACSLHYDRGGKLVLAATRGDGAKGEDITRNAFEVENIPVRIDMPHLEVRGEVYMPISRFEQYRGEYANPRNLAAGGLKQKNPEITKSYGLKFFAYNVLGTTLETEEEKLALLERFGFECVPYEIVDRDNLVAFCEKMIAARSALDFEVDGVVLKANLVAEQTRLGETSHHPKYAMAFKYQGDSGESRLIGVEWSVSRTGAITPVAVVRPVELSGAVVTRASLHNLAFFSSLQLKEHSDLLLTRRGGVIPHVEKCVKSEGALLAVPDTCPGCGGPTVQKNDFLYCIDPDSCVKARLGSLVHFASAVDAKGFGEKILEQLLELGYLNDISDFYRLSEENLLRLGNRGDGKERSSKTLAKKLYAKIQECRNLTLPVFLRSLGISGLGRSQSEALSKHFKSLEALRRATIEDIVAIEGFAQIGAEAVTSQLREKNALIDDLLSQITLTENPVETKTTNDTPFSDKVFLFSGELPTMTRKQAGELVEKFGGTVSSSVSKKLNVLVFSGARQGSKFNKVQELNASGADIEVWSDADFVEALKKAGHEI